MSEPQAYTESVGDVDDVGDSTDDAAPAETVGDDISADDTPGIPDEPEPFVEEIRAQADLPETGDPRVDEVLSGLAGIENLPTTEHVAVYDEVHRGLQDALANLDQG